LPRPSAVVFDVGNVLYAWNPRVLYERLVPEDRALDAFLRDVVSLDWHFQHDAGRPFAETSAELIAEHPQHAELIRRWGSHFGDSITGMMPGMAALIDDLDMAGVPLYAITNFSGEFWAPFRVREASLFDRFRGIIVSGDEKLLKPEPEIYRLALDRFALEAGDAVFVDDRADNVAGAQAIGMTGLLFTDADTLRRDLGAIGILA